jgi:hypothetical protein
MDTQFNVTFTASYFTLHTTINADNEEQAEANAVANLQDFYGIDLNQIRCQVEVEEAVVV